MPRQFKKGFKIIKVRCNLCKEFLPEKHQDVYNIVFDSELHFWRQITEIHDRQFSDCPGSIFIEYHLLLWG